MKSHGCIGIIYIQKETIVDARESAVLKRTTHAPSNPNSSSITTTLANVHVRKSYLVIAIPRGRSPAVNILLPLLVHVLKSFPRHVRPRARFVRRVGALSGAEQTLDRRGDGREQSRGGQQAAQGRQTAADDGGAELQFQPEDAVDDGAHLGGVVGEHDAEDARQTDAGERSVWVQGRGQARDLQATQEEDESETDAVLERELQDLDLSDGQEDEHDVEDGVDGFRSDEQVLD